MTKYTFVTVLPICVICLFLIFNREDRINFNSEPNDIGRQLIESGSDLTTALEKIKEPLRSLLSLIKQRYELDGPNGGPFFLSSNNINSLTWEMMKHKYVAKILSNNETFLMVFGGSSVTAGHDSYMNQSYPSVVRRRLAPIMSQLGIELVVHNIAQGANNCAPYILCYETMGGANPDFVGWEQSYNCGHDDGIFETAARVTGWSNQKGAMLYYSASGAWSPKTCPPSTDALPYCDETWTPAAAGLTEWKPTLEDVTAQKELLFKFNSDKATAARFAAAFQNEYKNSIGLGGFNVWEKNKHCQWVNPKNNKTEACTGIDAAGGCVMKFMTHEASVYGSDTGHGADWHPTKAFHMLRGEAIVWQQALILLDTVYFLEEGLKGKSREHLLDASRKFLNDLTPIPKPKKCTTYNCDHKPVCVTDFKPQYSQGLSLSEHLVGSTQWTYDAAEYGEWSLHYGYLDAKPLYSGTKTQGEIHFKVHIKGSLNTVWLCGTIKNNFAAAVVSLDLNVDTEHIDTKLNYKPSDKNQVWSKRKTIGFECEALLEVPKGDHVLTLSSNSEDEHHAMTLTHIITWE